MERIQKDVRKGLLLYILDNYKNFKLKKAIKYVMNNYNNNTHSVTNYKPNEVFIIHQQAYMKKLILISFIIIKI